MSTALNASTTPTNALRSLADTGGTTRALLERASAEEEGPKQAEWRARVMVEMGNIRAALNSALEDGDGEALIALSVRCGKHLDPDGQVD